MYSVLASSGIDYDIKLWAPIREEPFFDEVKAKEVGSWKSVFVLYDLYLFQ